MLRSTRYENLAALYRAQGAGMGAGLFSAGLSHAVSGAPNLLLLLVVFSGIFLFRMRGWQEFCALLSMLGTVVAYFAVYEVFHLDVSLLAKVTSSLLVVGLYVASILWGIDRILRVRAATLARKFHVPTGEALPELPLQESEHWLEPAFAAIRARRAAGRVSLLPAIARLSACMGGLALTVWFDNPLLIAVAAWVFLYQLIAIARLGRYYLRLAQPDTQDVLATHSRAPILFLRPFGLDGIPVSPMEDGWHGLRNLLAQDRRTFEEALTAAFAGLGPVVAIGRPGEDAAPLGAAREYVDDASWRQRVLERADASQFVIIECDATPGTLWEIRNVPQRVGLGRVLMVLPFGEDGYARRSAGWHERWAALREEFAFLPEVAEDAVAILFNEDDAPVVVRSSASSLRKRLEGIADAWRHHAG